MPSKERGILATGLRGAEFLRRCVCSRATQSRGARCFDHVASCKAAAVAATGAAGLDCRDLRTVQSSVGAARGPENVHQLALLSGPVSRGHILSLLAAGTAGSRAALQVRSTAADGELAWESVVKTELELKLSNVSFTDSDR